VTGLGALALVAAALYLAGMDIPTMAGIGLLIGAGAHLVELRRLRRPLAA